MMHLRLNCWLLLSSRDPDGGLLDHPVGVVRRLVSLGVTRLGKTFMDPIGVLFLGIFVSRACHGVLRRLVNIWITLWGKAFLDPIGVLFPGNFVARAWHHENSLVMD